MKFVPPVQVTHDVTASRDAEGAMSFDITPLVLRMEQAAEMLAVSRSKMYELAATGQVPSFKVGKSIRIPYKQLVAWVEDQTVTGGRN